VAFLGLAAFIFIAGMLAGGDGYDGGGGTSAVGVSGPAGSSDTSKSAPRPAHCYPVPVVGVAQTGKIYNSGVGTAMHCD
jgi:hypothetical protein